MTDFENIIKQYSELIDDFLVIIIFLKMNDNTNMSLPFLYSHTLELAAKTACYKLNLREGIKGHDILKILELIKTKLHILENYIPSKQDFKNYRKFWRPITETDNAVYMPAPKDIDRQELAYFIDNCMNLKYGFTADLTQVSAIQLCNEYVNPEFIKLLKVCRDTYSTQTLNVRLESKLGKSVTENSEIMSTVFKYLTETVTL